MNMQKSATDYLTSELIREENRLILNGVLRRPLGTDSEHNVYNAFNESIELRNF